MGLYLPALRTLALYMLLLYHTCQICQYAKGVSPMKAETVVSYIDGFNLYFGLRRMGWQRYYWMDIEALSLSLLKKQQLLAKTHYFTSRISNNLDKQRRQNTYLEALKVTGIELTYGKYRHNRYDCFNLLCPHKGYHSLS